jgi:outer membrane protein assembly factor BamB
MPGGFLTLSANGMADGTGILWVVMPFAGNANAGVVRGILRAFDASDVSRGELWDSESTGNPNDSLGQFAKFCPPTVTNGKVYVTTFQQEIVEANGKHVKAVPGDQPALVIYGLRNQ